MVIPTGRDVFVKLTACDGSGDVEDVQRDPQLLGPRARGQEGRRPRPDQHAHALADKPGTYLGQCAEYCGLSHANMRFRVIAKSPSDFQEWLSEQQQGPVNALSPTDADGKQVPAGPTQELIVNTFAVHELPHLRRLVEGRPTART